MASTDPADVVRKLRQHDNEFEAVYELLSVVDGKVDTLEAKVDAGFERIDGRFEQMDGRFARIESGQQEILDLLRGRGTPSPD